MINPVLLSTFCSIFPYSINQIYDRYTNFITDNNGKFKFQQRAALTVQSVNAEIFFVRKRFILALLLLFLAISILKNINVIKYIKQRCMSLLSHSLNPKRKIFQFQNKKKKRKYILANLTRVEHL